MVDDGGNSHKLGFANFENPEGAEKAIYEMNGNEMSSHTLFVDKSQKLAKRQTEMKRKLEATKIDRTSSNLYAKNLNSTIDDEGQRKEFSSVQTTTSPKVMTEDDHSNSFGLACSSSPENATKAVTEMNDQILVSKPACVQHQKNSKAHLASQNVQEFAVIRMQQVSQIHQGQNSFFFTPPMLGYFPPNITYFRADQSLAQQQLSGRAQHGSCYPTPQQVFNNQSLEPLTPSMLAAVDRQSQKQMFGERLFPLIQKTHPELAAKITGMLLEIENAELLHMLEFEEYLKIKVNEAVTVLQDYQAKMNLSKTE